MATEREKKIKVLNVIWAFSTGGIGQLFHTYANLGKHNPKLEIISVCIDLLNSDYDRNLLNAFDVKIIPIKSRCDLSWIISLGKLSKKVNPDVVFCHGFNGPIVIKLCSLFEKSIRVPMVCTYHGLYNPPTKRKALIADIINIVQAWIYKRFAHTVILVSKYSAVYLLEQGVPERKLQVVYNGISGLDLNIDAVKLYHKGISIGMVGRLDAIKGINYLIDAIKIIIEKKIYQFHLYIVGDGPEEDALKTQVKILGIDEYISFEGYHSNVPAWLKAWDIFCLPSLQENHSVALLEAMRAGKPIVCTNVGGNPETVSNENEALIVPACNPNALANALINLIQSEELRKYLGENARRKFYSCFTDTVMKDKLCEILYNVAKHEA